VWQADAVPFLLAGLLVTVLVMLVLAAAPVIAGVSLVLRLTRRGSAPGKPTPAEHILGRPLSTGALAAWLIIPLLIIGLWATADVLTEKRGPAWSTAPARPTLQGRAVPGVWKTSRGATLKLSADGHFTETDLPDPPAGETGFPGPALPRSGEGTWQLEGSPAGDQEVLLIFRSGRSLDLTVLWQPVSGDLENFVLEPYVGSTTDLNPAYQLTKQGHT